nr:PREDICTED: testicular haploid expressed gene protein-like [Equus przewalskii]
MRTALLLLPGDHGHTWCWGARLQGREAQSMGDHWLSSLNNRHGSEAKGRSERGQDDDTPSPLGAMYQHRGSKHMDAGELGSHDQEEETPPEEVSREEFLDTRGPGEALPGLEKDEEAVSEMRWVAESCSQLDAVVGETAWRLSRAKPRSGGGEPGRQASAGAVSRCAVVSRRVEELARPKRFYSEYYNSSRTTPIWPISKATLECQPSSRLRELATPKVRNNIWSLNMSEVGAAPSGAPADEREHMQRTAVQPPC